MADFTADRMTWLDQVTENPAITAAAFRVAYAIARKFNREHHGASGNLEAWPTQDELATDTRLSRRGVQKCIDALVEQGHLSVIVGKGRGLRSTYEAIIHEQVEGAGEDEEKANGGSHYHPEKANDGSPFSPEKDEPMFAFSDDKKANHRSEKANGEAKKGERPFAHKSLIQIFDKISEGESLSPSTRSRSNSAANDAPDRFEEFWRTYPRRVGKVAARKAFAKALGSGLTAEELILAAARIAAQREAEPDPAKRERFTPHPATWLNAGRWADEESPTVVPFARPGERPSFPNDGWAFRLARLTS